MKKKIALTLCVLAIPIVYLAACPYLAVSRIRDGLINKDSEGLSENIEFPTLKQHLKDQMNAAMAANMEDDKENVAMNFFATGVATLFIDKIIDNYVTPGGLTRMLSDAEITEGEATENAESEDPSEIFRNATYRYDSLHSFSVYVPANDGDGEMRMVLKRRGIATWKLCYLYFPDAAFDRKKRNQNSVPKKSTVTDGETESSRTISEAIKHFDNYDARLVRRLASEFSIPESDMLQLNWELEPNESDDGLLYDYVLTFGSDCPQSILDRIQGVDETRSIRVDPSVFDTDSE